MDLMYTAQLLGNFGEFIGAIAVVVTLAYLAVQVKHSKEATEASVQSAEAAHKLALANNHIARVDLITRSLRDMAASESLAGLRDKVRKEKTETLTESERSRITAWHLGQTYILDCQQYPHQLGLVDEDMWADAVDAIKIQSDAWQSLGVSPRRSSFARVVESIVREHSAEPQ